MTVSQGTSVKIRTVRGRLPPGVFSTRARHLAVQRKSVPTVVRLCFLLFVFTIPLEELVSDSISVAKFSGVLFFASYLFSPSRCFLHPSRAVWWFLGFVAIYALNGFLIPEALVGDLISRIFTLVQLILFVWVASSLLEDEKLARSVLLAYSTATVLLALGVILSLPGFSAEIKTGEIIGGMRMTAVGYNPNDLSAFAALAALVLIGLGLGKSIRGAWRRALLGVLTLPLLILLMRAGSRGGVAAFASGFSLLLVPLGRFSKRRIVALALALFALIAMGYMVATDPLFSARWTAAYREGDVAGRDKIYSAAIEMIAERPIFGWGPVEALDELGKRLGHLWGLRDPHDLMLDLFLEVGAIGAVPFLAGLWLCTRGAWRARMGNLGILPMALLIMVLVNNMAHTWLFNKSMWLVLALALARSHAPGYGAVKGAFLRRVASPPRLNVSQNSDRIEVANSLPLWMSTAAVTFSISISVVSEARFCELVV